MNYTLTGALVALAVTLALTSNAYSLELVTLNKQVDETNFVVNDVCSGTLISLEKKLILTANHCVQNLTSFIEEEQLQDDGTVQKIKKFYRKPLEVKQSILDGLGNITGTKVSRATIVGTDAKVDLAVVKIVGELTNTVESIILPEYETITRGEEVWIVGNPMVVLENSVTRGIVSAVKREIPGLSGLENNVKFLQIDGGIIGGNSGGAVYNTDGYLIGVVVMVGPSSHLGLAVDINDIRSFVDNPLRGIAPKTTAAGANDYLEMRPK